MWYTKNDINDAELSVLYSEWLKALQIYPEEFFAAYATEAKVDTVTEYLFQKKVPQSRFDEYVHGSHSVR